MSSVTIPLPCTIFEFLMLNDIMTLNLDQGHPRSLEMTTFCRSHTNYYWCSTVTIVMSCVISEIRRNVGR